MSEQQRITAVLIDKRRMLPLTDQEFNWVDKMQACPRCQERFTAQNSEVKHRNHRTGKFIDALCNKCNLQIESTNKKFQSVMKGCQIMRKLHWNITVMT